MALAFWVCAAITAVSAFVSLGYSIAGLRLAATAERLGYTYALARSVSLAAIAVVALFTGSVPFAVAIAIAMVVVQALDAVVGVRNHDRLKTYGPAVTALVNALALIWLLVVA